MNQLNSPPPEKLASSANSTYRPEIDGFRTIAILAVIINHFNPKIVTSGFLGVDIFFVISGFVVTASLSHKLTQNWPQHLPTFYARRIKRLIPALITCVLITCIIGCFFIPAGEIDVSIETGIASLFGYSNIYLLDEISDYFGSEAELNLFTHTWSLGIEAQFYLLFPIILGLCSHPNQTKNRRNILITVLGLTILSLITYLYMAEDNGDAAFFLLPSRFWELGVGCLTFLVLPQLSSASWRRIQQFIAPISTVLTVAVLFFSKDLQTLATVSIVLLTAITIWAFDTKSPVVNLFASKWFVKIGILSYSLYLWHWSVLVLSRWTIGISQYTIIFQLLLIIGLALASYHWIENPLRHANWSRKNTPVFGLYLTLLLTSAFFLGHLENTLAAELYSGNSEKYLSYFARNQTIYPNYTKDNCHLDSRENPEISPQLLSICTIPAKANQPTLFFVGNSHADHLRALAAKLAQQKGYGIDGISQSSCQFPYAEKKKKKCDRTQLHQYERVLKTAKKGDIVIIANRYEIKNWDVPEKNLSWVGIPQVMGTLNQFAELLQKKGVSTVLMMPLPEFSHNTKECLAEWFRPEFSLNQICGEEKSTLVKLRKPVYEKLDQTLSPVIHKYDPFNLLCPDEICTHFTSDNQHPLFIDSHHLTNYGAELLYDNFLQFLKQHSILK
ncbi:MAG TPA: acyltransferase [Oscillatoriaceae cyanobacterium M33_DOE_052]|uniref:Acyltransferase n=1 Tax=Planktothricoides sp. SpSt-374 TaxID=2282167 RepID=A0A7C3VHJ0_9CYAN|nr:acyltransferase [Oscillatoriaceae cyanobacterium M33_DOE_052]